MKIGVGQMEPSICNVSENLERVRILLEEAEKSGIEILVLPELCNSGYVFKNINEAKQSAEKIPSGQMSELLREWSSDERLVVAGICESTHEGLFNSAGVFADGKHITTYQKIHLFLDEGDWFLPGQDAPPIINFKDYRFGVMICFDWIFPEAARSLALLGANIIAHPANLVLPYCQDAMVTRSIENHVFTITANRIGQETDQERKLKFTGESQITDPLGKVRYRGPENKATVHVMEIDPSQAEDKNINPRNDLFLDRRERFYLLSREQTMQ